MALSYSEIWLWSDFGHSYFSPSDDPRPVWQVPDLWDYPLRRSSPEAEYNSTKSARILSIPKNLHTEVQVYCDEEYHSGRLESVRTQSSILNYFRTLPDGIEQIMIDNISILNRLGYHPNKLTADQYTDPVILRFLKIL